MTQPETLPVDNHSSSTQTIRDESTLCSYGLGRQTQWTSPVGHQTSFEERLFRNEELVHQPGSVVH
jgi:hypothetical protein